jgi:hypothetical protein
MQALNEIPAGEIHRVVQHMPKIELSYETNSHKKDDSSYSIGLAIPTGKKYYAWVTYDEEGDNVIYMMEINREHKIARIFWLPYEAHFTSEEEGEGEWRRYEMGTIFYGTILEGNPVYLIEDILYDRGIPTKYFPFSNKMSSIHRFLRQLRFGLHFALPIIWPREILSGAQNEEFIPEKWSNRIGYPVHHIQYRCADKIAPFVNIFFNKPSINIDGNLVTYSKPELREPKKRMSYKCNFRADYNKPQYRIATTFLVKADIDADIYRLFAYGRNKMREYYDIAYIGGYESSVFMNRIFRHIKENENLDFMEESDDEDEFENVDPERFVDLEKEVAIECVFSAKFKKWIPKKVVQGGKIVHIGQLCRV